MHDNIAFYYKLSHKIERIIYPNFIFEKKTIFSRLKNRKKVIFFNIEIITFYITSAFSIYLLLITSECQAPIIFLFADERLGKPLILPVYQNDT